jgi:hypothetical protein
MTYIRNLDQARNKAEKYTVGKTLELRQPACHIKIIVPKELP